MSATQAVRMPPSEQVHQLIREYVVAMAGDGSGRLPYINMDCCLLIVPPPRFLEILWSELVSASKIWELGMCVRLGTLILVSTRLPSPGPSLFTLFLRSTMRSIIHDNDKKPPQEQSRNILLMAATISSALCHRTHLEAASALVGIPRQGPETSSTADVSNIFAGMLKADSKSSPTSRMLLERLGRDAEFTAKWPKFGLHNSGD